MVGITSWEGEELDMLIVDEIVENVYKVAYSTRQWEGVEYVALGNCFNNWKQHTMPVPRCRTATAGNS